MSKGSEQKLSIEDIQMANAHEKMFNIINHQGNTHQNHNEIPLHIGRMTTKNKTKQKQKQSR